MFTNVDICTIAATKSNESYNTLSIAFKNVFDDINHITEDPYMTIGETRYTLEFFLTADYKVMAIAIYIASYKLQY